MDRLLTKIFRVTSLALALSLWAGCGGETPPDVLPATDGDAPAFDEAVPPPQPEQPAGPSGGEPISASGGEAVNEPGGDAPTQAAHPGMMLPDDMPLPDPTELIEPAGASGGKPQGMQLPDDLPPTANFDRRRGDHSQQLVALHSEDGEAAPESTPDAPATDSELELKFASWKEIDAAIGKTKRVTVVDFWSLACIPCLREYPHLVALQKKYPDRIQAIGVNVDFYGGKKYPPKSYEPRATAFLQAVKADFPNYICQTPSDEVFQSVKINALPAVLVFDEQGKLVERFTDASHSGGFSYQDDIVPVVERLLAE
ncbi:thiol-disulfide oxidoreductase [Allorhodopirellula solitaria]|uniref:Thiol-disulfide oxidoreductase n=2 Tax=Allorhodopirellula solitaria TaxID=2527987 RepID=A0A5C5YJ92_9BACT|nr:thiol-disulfide oxidoreductase [Allorhodopirellula solitaria]